MPPVLKPNPTAIPAHIFREYDIRGEVPSELNAAIALQIADMFARVVAEMEGVKTPRICLGWDGRVSSPELKVAITQGLTRAGAEVIEVGLGPTPMTYYSVFNQNANGCVMITGSHNPANYNGLKLMVGKRPFFGEMIQDLYQRMVAAGESHTGDHPQAVDKTEQGDAIKKSYLATQLAAAGTSGKPLNVVWDCGNGAAGEVVTALTKQLPGTHEVLFGEIDGRFPNHHPDPSVDANMQDLKQRVLATSADIGFAFDGDGDRIGVIDAKGRIWAGDQILAVCAKQVLRDHPGARIIADVKTSQGVFDAIAAWGGEPIMWKTGHSNIKTKLIESGAKLAGEMSGHMFFADEYDGFDDAIYAAMRLMRLLASSEKTSDQLYDELPIWHSTPEIRIDADDATKFQIIEQIAGKLKQAGQTFSDIDGVRVQTEQGWWLIRASNTQPVLVARAEARDAAGLAVLKSGLQAALQPFGVQYDAM